ncbi:YadA-like family protein [Paraburkholderia sp. JHI869]|uniref:beta strand repeat-containing protein n=1 Tax=Paraburkholderia sp. JHI869 TaxID=3112959 RepID=UPI003173B60E
MSSSTGTGLGASQPAPLGSNLKSVAALGSQLDDMAGTTYFHTTSSGPDSSATAENSIAVGSGAAATAENAIAVGAGAVASGYNSMAQGAGATAAPANAMALGAGTVVTTGTKTDISGSQSGVGAIALGNSYTDTFDGQSYTYKTVVTGQNAIAVGNGSTVAAQSGMAIGTMTLVTGNNSVAIGPESTASADAAVVFGGQAAATAYGSIALGNSATATNASAMALGPSALSTGNTSLALGSWALASGDTSVAIGAAATTTEKGSVAIGWGTTALGENAFATGSFATASGLSSVALGTGAVSTNDSAVALGRAAMASGLGALAQGTAASAAGDNSVAIGNMANATGLDAAALGAMANAAGSNSLALGDGSTASGSSAIAMGAAATASALNAAALGAGAEALGNYAQAIGASAQALNNGDLAIGTSSTASSTTAGRYATALGTNAYATNAGATAVGGRATATGASATALGFGAQAETDNSVALGSRSATGEVIGTASGVIGDTTYDYAGTSPTGTVSVGAAGAERTITNVAAGQVTDSSTDAVNGSQLFATNTQVTANTTSISNLREDVTTINGQITNINGMLADAVMYDSSTHATVTLGGAGATTPVALTNVANGALSASSVDAVNGSQLYALGATTDASGNITNKFVAYDDTSMNAVTFGGSDHTPVKLTNVANGTLSASSLDAVNGQQLNATNTNLTNLAGDVTNIAGEITNIKGKVADAVLYDSSAHTEVTLGGSGTTTPVALTNVANGALSASSVDAVNGSQLYALGATTDASGNITNKFVAYDDTSMSSVTLGGSMDHAPVALHNVANGEVSTASLDAVNGSQLYGLASSTANALGGKTKVNADGSIGAPTYLLGEGTYHDVGTALDAVMAAAGSGNVDGVVYDTSEHNSVTLGGADHDPVRLTNVANGGLSASSVDAVNGSQLYALGATTDASGNITNKFVAYDDTSMNAVTLGGSMDHAPVALHNVAAGDVSTTSLDAVNGTQLYGLASSTAKALGGNTQVNPDGSISTPAFRLQGTANTYTDVGSALNAVMAAAIGGNVDSVLYDTSAHNAVTLGGADHAPVLLTNVANGGLNASSVDAVNGSQLYALGAKTDASGNITNAFVAYDDTSMSKVTMGGSGHAPVVLTNVANGALSVSSVDAVNGSQLYALGAKTDASGNIINAFVAYDDTSMNSVTFGGSGHDPVVLHNVANGVASNDAVNVAQLEAMGAKIDGSGNVMNGFVAYDDSTMSSVTLGGGMDHAPVVLHNVANGAVHASSLDAVNGQQLYGVASSTASALGGGSTVSPDGTVSAPTYNIGGDTFNNVGGALTNLDSRVGTIETNYTTIAGQVANAVQYDSSAHDSVTLGGSGATSAVALHNVANGVLSADSLDAVNGSQLYATNVQVENLNQQIQNINVNGSEYLSTNTTNGAASATGSNSIAAGGGAIASGANSTAMGDMAKATGNNSVALGANSVADEDNTVSVGSQGNERRITNVAPGVNPTDAVNVGQLQSGLNSLQSGLNSVARNAYGGIAAATALTMIPDVDQGKTIAVGVGTANFKGYQAAALGATARITQNIKVKLGGGYASGGGATFGGGMSYQW